MTGTVGTALRYQLTLGIAAMGGRGFYYPVDTALGNDGRIYVLGRSHDGDPRGIQICMMDLDSEFFGIFGSVGEGDGQFIWTAAIALDSSGRVYVSDEHLNRISVFSATGEFLSKWGATGSGPGEIDGPSGLAFDADDNLYVVDHRNHRIQKFTRDGELLSSFGGHGSGEGQLDLPWGATVAPGGDVYVADWGNHRVQRFSADGRFVAAYGGPGSEEGRFHRPSSVAVDDDGYIYVADWGNERVQLLDPEGGFAASVRGEATLSPWAQDFLNANLQEKESRERSDLEPDLAFLGSDVHGEAHHMEKYFWSPVSVKLDREGRLYVTDRNRHRVQVYARSSSP
jgi:DNA-binding beta-propeller fold protein YncE